MFIVLEDLTDACQPSSPNAPAEGAALAALADDIAGALFRDATLGPDEIATVLEAVASLRFLPPERAP